MPVYYCRMSKPYLKSNWMPIDAPTPEEAANIYHSKLRLSESGIKWIVREEKDGLSERYDIYFALIEVEGYGEWISRIYHYGLFRKGGIVRKSRLTLKAIAESIGFEGNPEELLKPGWDYEETRE